MEKNINPNFPNIKNKKTCYKKILILKEYKRTVEIHINPKNKP